MHTQCADIKWEFKYLSAACLQFNTSKKQREEKCVRNKSNQMNEKNEAKGEKEERLEQHRTS